MLKGDASEVQRLINEGVQLNSDEFHPLHELIGENANGMIKPILKLNLFLTCYTKAQ